MAWKAHNPTPGMDEKQMTADRFGFSTTVEHLTGGVMHEWYEGGGMEVGLPYDMDMLGEERHMITYTKSTPMPSGKK